MAYCNSCGTQSEPRAQFCVKCGARLSQPGNPGTAVSLGFNHVCATLISQLDTVRNKWFEISKELVADTLPSGAGGITYPELLNTSSVSLSEDDTPDSFPFKTVDGETIEAAVICWQFLNATAFAMEQKSYMTADQFETFTESLMKAIVPGTRWNISLAGLFSSPQIDDGCISEVLAHFLLNDPTDSELVRSARAVLLRKSLPFLRGLSYLATAVAFGDARTAEELMRQLKSP